MRRTHPKHALARAAEYTALGTGVRAEARPIAHFLSESPEPHLDPISYKKHPPVVLHPEASCMDLGHGSQQNPSYPEE